VTAAATPNAQPGASPLLEVSGLRVSFGPVPALDGVDLAIGAGELVALAGENGAGKTTLVRCIAGDISPGSGTVNLSGRSVPADPRVAGRRGIAVVWQDLALCDNLDVAGNVLLGQETRRLMFSSSRLHAAAASSLKSLKIPITDTGRSVTSLSGGQRQLVAVARAMSREPQLLLLDEPTASLGVTEARQVEQLVMSLRDRGTTIVLASHDIELMFRLADRIIVLRQGRVVADLDPHTTHPDDVIALLSGQQVDSSARRQLTRLHGLADRLVSADPSASLSLILSALGAALGADKLCIHVVSGRGLICGASLGFAQGELALVARLPFGRAGGPPGEAAAARTPVVDERRRASAAWNEFAGAAGIAGSWSFPVIGPVGLSAVITVFRSELRPPERDELDLVELYAGYAASTVERDRLLDQVTARNRVLETIREMLETLAGPIPVGQGLVIALQSLRRGLRAEEVALLTQPRGEPPCLRGYAGPRGVDPGEMSSPLWTAAKEALASARRDGSARAFNSIPGRQDLTVAFVGPDGPTVLLATSNELRPTKEETALIEDAAHSLRLALEREQAGLAHQEAAALRRSRELQREFLSMLSHELRTPLTAIRGYASSLMAPDVTWDGDSQRRFLDRIGAESARVGRLVDDLLDFSAIESGVMRLQLDWCDIPLVVEAALGCLPAEHVATVSVACEPALPAVWADHDRLEQVFVNLLTNAFRHNPPGTRVRVIANAVAAENNAAAKHARVHGSAPGDVEITVVDDGTGMPPELAAAPFEPTRGRRSPSSGAGLGLSISRGIVEAHGGTIDMVTVAKGTCFRVRLPIEGTGTGSPGPDHGESVKADEIVALVGHSQGVGNRATPLGHAT
jgi:signal transduction histidine kinase/ABC-type multidrug transport system ATPase subunit